MSIQAKKYTVEVYTGNEKNCGTDANVFITLFGDKGDSGERALRESETNRNKFERNKVSCWFILLYDLCRGCVSISTRMEYTQRQV